MKKKFNPYDLNDIANIDKFIEEWKRNPRKKSNKKPLTFIKKTESKCIQQVKK